MNSPPCTWVCGRSTRRRCKPGGRCHPERKVILVLYYSVVLVTIGNFLGWLESTYHKIHKSYILILIQHTNLRVLDGAAVVAAELEDGAVGERCVPFDGDLSLLICDDLTRGDSTLK